MQRGFPNTAHPKGTCAPFEDTFVWEAAWAWWHVACWAAIDVLQHSTVDEDCHRNANKFLLMLLSNMSLVRSFTSEIKTNRLKNKQKEKKNVETFKKDKPQA